MNITLQNIESKPSDTIKRLMNHTIFEKIPHENCVRIRSSAEYRMDDCLLLFLHDIDNLFFKLHSLSI